MTRIKLRISFALSIFLFLGSCRTYAKIPIEELLIDVSLFPEGTVLRISEPEPIPRAPLNGTRSIQSTTISFEGTQLSAFQHIRVFKNLSDAQNEFARQKVATFRDREEYDEYYFVPDELPYVSPSADQSHFACVLRYAGMACSYILQDGVFFSEFFIVMNDLGETHYVLTYSELANILETIDAHFYAYSN